MTWKSQKLSLIGVGIALLCFLTFLVGIAFGASSDLNDFKSVVLPILSTVGNWVAGTGALGAVVVALWLAEKQRQREKEFLNLDFSFVITPTVNKPILAISAVSVGNRPSNINSIALLSPGAGSLMFLANFLPGSSALPKVLGYGEKATFLLEEGFERHIASYLKTYANGSAEKLELKVSTTTENFVLRPDKGIRRELERLVELVDDAPKRQPVQG